MRGLMLKGSTNIEGVCIMIYESVRNGYEEESGFGKEAYILYEVLVR